MIEMDYIGFYFKIIWILEDPTLQIRLTFVYTLRAARVLLQLCCSGYVFMLKPTGFVGRIVGERLPGRFWKSGAEQLEGWR